MTSRTLAGDKDLTPVFFWREFQPYGFMSQWYESAFEVDGVTYLTAEMWMMIQKARLFGDEASNVVLLGKGDADTKAGSRAEDGGDNGAGGASGAWEEG